MPNQTYFIELEVDEGWLKAIDQLTNDVYDGEVCRWIRLDANTEGI
jgi:hypothetical protein